MFKIKTKLLSVIFACLLFASPASAEFFSDVILTGTEGIWVDSRSYASLQAAVTAVGAADREIVIIGAQGTVTLVIPANVRLKFLRDGSINNTGQLTINTRNVVAEDRQIFTGTGDIDFIDGSVVRSSWFSNAVEALDVTLDDTLTMVISETGSVTANSAVGNDVSLKWEASDNHLIVYGGRILSNVKNLEAGNYQIFAGAGDIDFLDGTELYLSWFRRLRSVLTWIETEEVTIFVNEDSTVDYTQASTANESIKFISGNTLAIPAGVTLTLNGATETASDSFNLNATAVLTINGPLKSEGIIYAGLGTLNINGPFECGRYLTFPGTGTLTLGAGSVGELYPEWWQENTIPGTTDMTAAIQAALDAGMTMPGGLVSLAPEEYIITDTLHVGRGDGAFDTVAMKGTLYSILGIGGTEINASSFLDRPAINIQGARGIELADFGLEGGNIAPDAVAGDETDVEADYITIGATYGRYNPYAGIAISGYLGVQPPSDFYPGTYGKVNSSLIRITNVHIRHFVVGIVNNPSNTDQQGDNVVYDQCLVDYCAYAFSFGGSQGRANTILNCAASHCRTYLTNEKYGKQIGAPPRIIGGLAASLYRLFNIVLTTDVLHCSGLYSEKTQTIGNFGRGLAGYNTAANISGCMFIQNPTILTDRPPIVNLYTNKAVHFSGCHFSVAYGIFNLAGNGFAAFTGCSFRPFYAWSDEFYIGRTYNLAPPIIEMHASNYWTNLYNEVHEANTIGYMYSIGTPKRLIFSAASRLLIDRNETYKYVRGATNSFISSAVAGILWADVDTVTFTATTVAEFAVGDILFWKTAKYFGIYNFYLPAMKVVDITGAVVTADALFDPNDYDKTWAPAAAYICQREWAPGVACTGDTHTNFTIDNVADVAVLRIGDFLKGSVDIPANTRITNIIGNTVTISKAATGTTVGINLYFAQVTAL